jgi:hypothetical protein
MNSESPKQQEDNNSLLQKINDLQANIKALEQKIENLPQRAGRPVPGERSSTPEAAEPPAPGERSSTPEAAERPDPGERSSTPEAAEPPAPGERSSAKRQKTNKHKRRKPKNKNDAG